MSTLCNTLGALAFLVLFFAAQAMTGDDVRDAIATAQSHDDAVIEARLAAMSLSDNERLARRICNGLHAERALVYQLRESGEYVCRRAGGAL